MSHEPINGKDATTPILHAEITPEAPTEQEWKRLREHVAQLLHEVETRQIFGLITVRAGGPGSDYRSGRTICTGASRHAMVAGLELAAFDLKRAISQHPE